MAASKLYNLARMSTATTGTGTITLGSAVSGFLSFASAGVSDGDTVTYAIKDGSNSEIGRGVYTSSGTTLTRSVLRSTNSNSAINLSGSAEVFITAAAEDFTDRDVLFNELALTTSILALQVADNTNVALFLGTSGNRVFDSFDALTYVDVAGATNLDSGTAGLLKPAIAGTTVTIGTYSAGPNNSGGNYTWVDRRTAVLNGVTVTKIGVYSTNAATYVVKIVKRNSTSNFDVVVSETFVHPGGGFADHTLASSYAVPGSGTYYLAVYNSSSAIADATVSGARSLQAGDITGTGQTISDDTGALIPSRYEHTATTQNLTVRSTSFTALSAPSTMKAVIRVKETDAATAGTDYTFEVSRDGGTTWTTATLTELFTSPSPTASIRVCETNTVDVSGQPSGTSPRWRFKTLNNKMVELHDAALYWS